MSVINDLSELRKFLKKSSILVIEKSKYHVYPDSFLRTNFDVSCETSYRRICVRYIIGIFRVKENKTSKMSQVEW